MRLVSRRAVVAMGLLVGGATGLLVGACGVGRQDTAKVIQPGLLAAGEVHERAATMGGFRLGTWIVREVETTWGPERAIGTQAIERSVELRAALEVGHRGRTWSITCTGVRLASRHGDLAAVLDEPDDSVSVACTLAAGEDVRELKLNGRLDRNLGGTVAVVDATQVQPMKVELLLHRQRFDTIQRRLTEPVGQLVVGQEAIAAMILAPPQKLWIRPDLGDEGEVAVASLVALSLLPLGFER